MKSITNNPYVDVEWKNKPFYAYAYGDVRIYAVFTLLLRYVRQRTFIPSSLGKGGAHLRYLNMCLKNAYQTTFRQKAIRVCMSNVSHLKEEVAE